MEQTKIFLPHGMRKKIGTLIKGKGGKPVSQPTIRAALNGESDTALAKTIRKMALAMLNEH